MFQRQQCLFRIDTVVLERTAIVDRRNRHQTAILRRIDEADNIFSWEGRRVVVDSVSALIFQ
jgi:hypothetical protein